MELMMQKWRDSTGERKIKGDDARLAILGDRSHTWLDETEQSEFAGLEEPFAMLHKAVLHIVHRERNRDAAPQPGPRRSMAHLANQVQKLVQEMVDQRWQRACERRRTDGGLAQAAFRRQWEAPNLAVVHPDGQRVTVTMLMRASTRASWAERNETIQTRNRRMQQYEPPKVLPPDTVSVFTDGSADPHEMGKRPPPAGFGVAAVCDGHGPEHVDGTCLHEACGQILIEQRNITATTNNVAELKAFIEGLKWARCSSIAQGRAVCMRYDSKYASHIASGAWRAKRHKKLAAEARQQWAALRKSRRGRLWMRHVKGHSGHTWNERADRLADHGKRGWNRSGPPPEAAE